MIALFCIGCGDAETAGWQAPTAAAPHGPQPHDAAAADRCAPGERRGAFPGERASYCVCPPESRIWTCYGPDPEAKEVTDVTCSTAERVGEDADACWQNYADCSDGRRYGVSCITGYCACAIDGNPYASLEPGASCPNSIEELNETCGWELSAP